MGHIEPDELATLALDGVQPEADARAHLDECDACRTEYEALVRTVELGRAGASAREFEAPPSRVCAAIHGELALAPELAADPFEPDGVDAAARARPQDEAAGARITPLADRRPRSWWPIAIAAAAVGVVAGIAVGVVATGILGTRPGEQTVVASATLEAFPGWSSSGSALLEQDDAGARSIGVELDADVPPTEVREVWLIRSDASGLVSLGLLEGSSGRFAVPDGIDLEEFTLVDVSAEPVDGDPAHSGDSIVRGELRRV